MIHLVRNGDPATRALAIRDLGRRRSTEAVLPLVEAMEDASLRPVALEALAAMKDEATPSLARLLESPDPGHRKNAAFILGEWRSPEVIRPLVALLGDQSREIHVAAYQALAAIGEGTLDALQAAVQDPDPNVRIGMANALGIMTAPAEADELAAPAVPGPAEPVSLDDLLEDEIPAGLPGEAGGTGDENEFLFEDSGDGRPGVAGGRPAFSPENRGLAISLLRQLLEDENPHVRTAASAALRRAGETSFGSVIDGLNSPDAQARKDAISAMGQNLIIREIPAAIPPLIEALFDEDPEIRFLAAKSLRYAKDPRTTTPLNACLLDVNPKVRQEAVEGLRRRKDPRILDPLVHCLQDDSPGVRRTAASALGEFGDPGAKSALMRCRNDPDPGVRDAAARAFAVLGPGPDPETIIRLWSPDPAVRSRAVAMLGKGKDEEGKDLVTGALDDEDAGVRRAAAEALCRFSHPGAVAPLLEALKDTDEKVRVYAIRALALTGDPGVLPPIAAALKDSSPEVRAEAVSHLPEFGESGALPLLIGALLDPEDAVCREAILALGTIGGESTKAALRELEQKTEEPLQLAAIRTALDQLHHAEEHGGATPGAAPEIDTPGRVVITAKKKTEPEQSRPHSIVLKKKSGSRDETGASPECLPLEKKNPEAARVWKNLMVTAGGYLEREEYGFAKPVLERAWNIFPDSELLVNRLGFTLSQLGLHDEALRVYERGISINPRNDEFWSNLGALLANLERYDEALRSYKQALALCMTDGRIWYETGLVLNNLGRYEEAVKCFDRALMIRPDYPEAQEGREIAEGNVGR